MTQKINKKPAHQIRYGNVSVTIWKNENGSFSTTAERSYLKDEKWHRTSSYGRDDLPKLSKALDEAYRWIFQDGKDAGGDHE